MAEVIRLKVFRFEPGKGAPRFDEFQVPYEKGMTVLDALNYIQGYIDPSLAYRVSCRAAVCGSCAMHIDGRYRLACETQASPGLVRPMVIRPLAHLPVIRDLVVDMGNFWKQYRKIQPYLMAGDATPDKERIQTPADRARLDQLVDCILCASCHSSCPMTASDEDYLGPAAMLKANRFIVDSRDKGGEERFAVIADEHGIWRCHTVFNCSLACPKDLDPAGSIGNLKREAAKKYICKSPSR